MPRRRNAVDGRGRGPAVLPPWPLDPPRPPAPARQQLEPPTRGAQPGDAYFCRRCGVGGDGPVAPAGWLRLQRRGDGQRDSWRPWQTLGLYCSAPCLAAELTAGADPDPKARTP